MREVWKVGKRAVSALYVMAVRPHVASLCVGRYATKLGKVRGFCPACICVLMLSIGNRSTHTSVIDAETAALRTY